MPTRIELEVARWIYAAMLDDELPPEQLGGYAPEAEHHYAAAAQRQFPDATAGDIFSAVGQPLPAT
jgi:hypothetical protein